MQDEDIKDHHLQNGHVPAKQWAEAAQQSQEWAYEARMKAYRRMRRRAFLRMLVGAPVIAILWALAYVVVTKIV